MEAQQNTQAEPLEPLQSVAAVMALWDKSRSFVYGQMNSGALPYVQVGDRRMFEPSALRRYVAERRVPLKNDDGASEIAPSSELHSGVETAGDVKA